MQSRLVCIWTVGFAFLRNAAVVAQWNCSAAVSLSSQLPLDTTEQAFGDDVAVIGYGNGCDGGEGLWYSYVPNKVEILFVEVSEVAGEDYYPHEWAIFSGTCANLTCINDAGVYGRYSHLEP